tara:strand:+ start:976 stop:1335 length:360 start_codon:yes stop_codon:yes gene_type:complete
MSWPGNRLSIGLPEWRMLGSAAPTPPAANSSYNRAKKLHMRTCIDILPLPNPKILKLYEAGGKFATQSRPLVTIKRRSDTINEARNERVPNGQCQRDPSWGAHIATQASHGCPKGDLTR